MELNLILKMSLGRAKSTFSAAGRNKTLKYRNLSANYIFYLVAFETFGGAGLLAATFLSPLATHLAEVNGEARGCSSASASRPSPTMLQAFWSASIAIREVFPAPPTFQLKVVNCFGFSFFLLFFFLFSFSFLFCFFFLLSFSVVFSVLSSYLI